MTLNSRDYINVKIILCICFYAEIMQICQEKCYSERYKIENLQKIAVQHNNDSFEAIE